MKKKRLLTAFVICALSTIVVANAPSSRSVSAQKGVINLVVQTSVASDSFKALIEIPVMVSVIKDGQVLKQTEVRLNSQAIFSLPTGEYDIRVEGDRMQTLVKRGIHVNEGERTDIFGGPMHTGVGVKIIEYAVGGLSREEVGARLRKIEAAVVELQKARQNR